jgi:hypothetical protein
MSNRMVVLIAVAAGLVFFAVVVVKILRLG